MRALPDEDVAQAAGRCPSCWCDQTNRADMLGEPLSSLRDHPHRLGGRDRWAKTRLQK